jgi:hypothetical protein
VILKRENRDDPPEKSGEVLSAMKQTYSSDLTKRQWKYLKKRLPKRQHKACLK